MLQFITHPSISQYIMGIAFLIAGILHFVKPGMYIPIMPDYIPYQTSMVYISGVAEILGGIGVLINQTQNLAAWGLILLLIAVLPVHIDMLLKAFRYQGWQSLYFIAVLLRLPLQFLLMYWVYWACIQN